MILSLLKILPRRLLSRAFGWLMWQSKPRFMALFLKKIMCYSLGVSKRGAEKSFEIYPSFGAWFARKLEEGARPLAKSPWVFPSDGRLTQFGWLDNNKLIQCKGMDYRLEDLLKNDATAKRYKDGFYMVIYLAPYNYHRVHAPSYGELKELQYLSGDLWPVNDKSVSRIPNLFCLNERFCLDFQDQQGKSFNLIMVGATNVGGMELSFLPNERANSNKAPRVGVVPLPHKIQLEKGTDLGVFHLGSTVILLLEKDLAKDLDLSLLKAQKVEMGQTLAWACTPRKSS